MNPNNPICTITQRNIGQTVVQTINARELHAFLESKQRFSDWIKNRIGQYGFAENIDYVAVENLSDINLCSANNEQSAKARPQKRIDYHTTISMAKELAMVERTAKGREARLYFIECEQRYLATIKNTANTQNITMKRLLDNIERALNIQSSQNQRLINLQKQCLDLQAQTLTNQNHLQNLMEKVIDNSAPRKYRNATKDDIAKVKALLEKGHTYNQIATELGISPYFVARIKQGRYTINTDGTLKASDHIKSYS